MTFCRSVLPVSLLLSACCGVQWAQVTPGMSKQEGFVHRAAQQAQSNPDRVVQALRSMPRLARKAALQSPSASEVQSVAGKPGLTPVGVARALPADALAQGEWSTTPEGKPVWRLILESSGAESVRVHFRDFHVGAGSLWLLPTAEGGTSVIGPYTGDGLFQEGEFWTDSVPGEALMVAYEPADGKPTSDVPFRIAALSHRFPMANPSIPAGKASGAATAKLAAASCTLDVTCHAEYKEPASAVAMIVFESEDGTYQCSGALISSAAQPAVPFFLTANHCISTAAEARSAIVYFNYQTPTCNGTPPARSTLPRVTGSTFIAGQSMAGGDFTLLQLSGFPNTNVKVLGWSANELAANQTFTSISHPVGDYQRIAFGQRTRDTTIRFSSGETLPASRGYQVAWTQGVTQGGSSGSPLLVQVSGKEYVVGTLSAGPAIDEDNDAQVCSTRNLVASFGRFTAAAETLAPVLNSPTGADILGVGTSSTLTVANAASQQRSVLAPGSLATLYGAGLASATQAATSTTLPTTLDGTSIEVVDTYGTGRLAQLLYVSPTQINFLVPDGLPVGPVRLTIRPRSGSLQNVDAVVDLTSPALFSANGTGQGIGAILVVRQRASGQVISYAYTTSATGTIRSAPISLGDSNEQVYLTLFGTGLRGATQPGSVTARIGGVSVPVAAVAAQPTFAGLDQVNIGPLPTSLAGRGTLSIALTVQGKSANLVTARFQ